MISLRKVCLFPDLYIFRVVVEVLSPTTLQEISSTVLQKFLNSSFLSFVAYVDFKRTGHVGRFYPTKAKPSPELLNRLFIRDLPFHVYDPGRRYS